MAPLKPITVYLDTKVCKALCHKAAQTDVSVSSLVNAALRLSLSEDLADLAIFDDRANESNLDFERVLAAIGPRSKKQLGRTLRRPH